MKGTYAFDSARISPSGVMVMYIPRLDIALPPIILRIQPHINQNVMISAIDYCVDIYLQYNQLPLVLFIASDKLSDPFLDSFLPLESNRHLHVLPNTVWCRKCFFLSSSSDDANNHKDELLALSRTLLHGTNSPSLRPALRKVSDTFLSTVSFQ